MRFQIKKILEGYDPAELIEQSMYCFGSDSSDNDNSGGDEAMEVAERVSDQNTGNFGGDNTNVNNDITYGYASDDARDNYVAQQTALANAVASGQSINDVGSGGGLSAFGGQGGGMSTQATAGDQSILGDMAGGSLREIDPIIDQTITYSPSQVPNLELMNEVPYDIFGMQNRVNKILEDRDAEGLYTQVTRDDRGNVTGAFNDAPMFGLDFLPNVRTYTGLDQNPYNEDRSFMDSGNESQTTPPISNPITGKDQCPDGYVFDSDLQACRLKTRADDAMGTPRNPPDMNAPAFTRNYSLLNTAPSNLPQGFDYNQANQNFMSRFATRPSAFKNPPTLLGYTPFRSS